jgi:YidC/Oxa1 family membrane protein insertase
MEKRTIVVIVLSILVILLWNHFVVAPKQEQLNQQAVAEQALLEAAAAEREAAMPPAQAEPVETTADPVAMPPETETETAPELESWPAVSATAEEAVVIEDSLYRVELTNTGGRVKSWILKAFNGGNGDPLELVAASAHTLGRLPLEISYGGPETTARINSALWQVERSAPVDRELTDTFAGEVAHTLRLVYADGRGLEVAKEFVFYRDNYHVGFSCQVKDRGVPQEYEILLGPGMGNPSKEESKNRYFFFGRVLMETSPPGGSAKIERVADSDVAKSGDESGYLLGFIRKRLPYIRQGDALLIDTRVRWIGIEDNYFIFSMVPQAEPGPARIHRFAVDAPEAEAEEKKATQPEIFLAVSTTVSAENPRFDLYVGPKEEDALRAGGLNPNEVIDFGFFGFIGRPLLWMLNAIYGVLGNYGFSIMVLTIMIKILFLPLTHKQLTSMKKMQGVQPKMKQIQAKYKKDKSDMKGKQKMNEEVMALYKKEGVNPLGGCFPLLLQLPVLYAFYSFLPVAIELRQAPFILWVQDLSLKDPFYVTPIVMGATMFLQQKLTPMASVDPTQRRMFTMMPLIFTVFFINLPSGLVLYWLVNNVLSIFQQIFINKQKDKPVPALAGDKGKSAKAGAIKPRKKK